MRIDDGNKLPPAQLFERSQKSGTQRVADKTRDAASDVSSISEVAAQAAQASGVSGANEKRLELLRVAVESGSYHVSSSALAKSIVDAHLKP